VRLINAGEIVIDDVLNGSAEHKVNLRYHLAQSQVKLQNATAATAIYPGGTRLVISIDGPEDGFMEIEEGWMSKTWYIKEATPVINFMFEGRLPVKLHTILRTI
jgi:hypothetical protein